MQDGWVTAGYNALNQPMYIWSGGVGWTYFAYDPLGRCVKRWADNGAISYLYYDGWNLIQEGSQSSYAERQYIHGARVDEIVASYRWGWDLAYHHYDASGHCTLLTNSAGNIREQYDYDAFGYPYFYDAAGNNIGYSLFANRFLFTGREWLSDLKLYDYRNRLYQPELGRFMQPDPKEFAAGDYNLYRYCHNDPVNRNDPMGLDTAVAIGTIRDDSFNIFGHASMALTGQGAFSSGTGTALGSNFTGFLSDQSGHRETKVYILHTTPAQEAAIKKNFEESAKKGLPNVLRHPIDGHNDNCATRVSDALRAGGQNIGHPKFPGQLHHILEQKVRDGSATKVVVPLHAPIPEALRQFDKRP
jgi:RHS repeat-associated protein